MEFQDGYKIISTGVLGGEKTETSDFGFPDHKLAVFDLKSDPCEYVNLIDSQEGREVLRWAIERHSKLKNRK